MKLKKFCLNAFLILILIILTGCGNQEESGNIKEKVNEEINYLDLKIISLANILNGISLQNYKVETQEIEMPETSSQSEESGGSSSSGGGESSSGAGGEQQEKGEQSSSSEENSTIISEMKTTSILASNENQINWENIKAEIELMYSTWDTIMMDLYKLNVPTENINGFSRALDETTLSIKNEDVSKSISSLAKLYSYLPTYLEYSTEDNEEINIKLTKQYIIDAFALATNENWGAVSTKVNDAINSFTPVLNDLEFIKGKEHLVNRIYIILNEMQSSLVNNDKDIFFINYKNIMNELNIL